MNLPGLWRTRGWLPHYGLLFIPVAYTLMLVFDLVIPDAPFSAWLAAHAAFLIIMVAGVDLALRHQRATCPRCVSERPFLAGRLARLGGALQQRQRIVGQHYLATVGLIMTVGALVGGVIGMVAVGPAGMERAGIVMRVFVTLCLWWSSSWVIYHKHFRDRCTRCGRLELRRNQRRLAGNWLKRGRP